MGLLFETRVDLVFFCLFAGENWVESSLKFGVVLHVVVGAEGSGLGAVASPVYTGPTPSGGYCLFA